MREAWATGALEHPNIVPVHDIRMDGKGTPVIVLKRIEGDCWTALMHNPEQVRERFGATDVLEWNLDVLRQVSQAIRFAHSRGILHRDIKPDNVMIGAFGEVYLVDWGIALTVRDDKDCPLARAKDQTEMAGTPCYLAPEMLGNAPLDQRTDIYLLGAVLYEILAGKPPHSTTGIDNLVRDIRASSPTVPADTPAALATICLRAMSAAPIDRFPSAKAFSDALREFQQSRGSQHLAATANTQLRALHTQMRIVPTQRQEIYRTFGAVRFGFENALHAWPANGEASSGLRKAHLALLAFELKNQNPQAALSLLNEISDPPEDLKQEVEEQLARQSEEQEELEVYRNNSNTALGSRTRTGLMVGLGALWATLPLVEHFWPDRAWSWRNDYGAMIAASVALFALAAALWYWGRESLTRTAFNRKLTLILALCFPAQITLFLGANALDMPHIQAELFLLLIWGILAGAAAATVEKRFWPSVLAYCAGFVLASYTPQFRFLIMSASHVVLTINCVYLWRRLRHHSRGEPLDESDQLG